MKCCLAVALAFLAGCGAGVHKAAGPERHAPTAELWAFAPADSTFGLVAGDGSLAELLAASQRWLEIAELHPVGRQLVARLRAELDGQTLDAAGARARFGLDVERGFALFGRQTDGAVPDLLVVPVVDRALWRKANQMELVTEAGVDLDRGNGLTCSETRGRYVCTTRDNPAAGASIGPLARRASQLAAELRGDVEALVTFAPGERVEWKALPSFAAPSVVAFALRVDRAGTTLRWWSDGGPRDPAFLARPLSPAASERSRGATGALRLDLPFAELARHLPMDVPLPLPITGIETRAHLLGLFSGETVWVTRGHGLFSGAMYFFVRDEAKVKTLLDFLCTPERWPLARREGARCVIELPDLRPLPRFTTTIRVDEGALVLTVGDETAPAGEPAAHAAGHADSRDILAGAWQLSAWGLGFDVLRGPDGRFAALLAAVPASWQAYLPYLDFASYLGANLYELGFAAGFRRDGLHAELRLTSFAGDLAPVQAAHREALKARAQGNYGDYLAAMKSVADRFPDSLAGKQGRYLGDRPTVLGPPASFGGGVLAGVAVPAFQKYVQKSKTREAVVTVQRMSDGARRYQAAHGKFPAVSGTARVEEPGSCCGPDGHCVSEASKWDASPWKELEFAPPEPHLFTYEYESDGSAFTARALGDLDCDGEHSTFEMIGVVGPDGVVEGGVDGGEGIYKNLELE